MKTTPIVLMAGGRGKRLMPMTKDTPKPMLPVNGRPMLEWIIKRFTDQGYGHFIISLGYLGEQIQEYFGDGSKFGCSIRYVREDEPLGTAGALRLIGSLEENFIVANADVLASVDYDAMLRFHRSHESTATIGAATHRVEIPYGVLRVNGSRLEEIEEKPELDFPISAGVYVFSPDAVECLPPHTAYVDMPQFIQLIAAFGREVSVFPIAGSWMDVGTPDVYARAMA